MLINKSIPNTHPIDCSLVCILSNSMDQTRQTKLYFEMYTEDGASKSTSPGCIAVVALTSLLNCWACLCGSRRGSVGCRQPGNGDTGKQYVIADSGSGTNADTQCVAHNSLTNFITDNQHPKLVTNKHTDHEAHNTDPDHKPNHSKSNQLTNH